MLYLDYTNYLKKKAKFIILAIVLGLFLSVSSFSQKREIKSDHYNILDGLLHNTIHCITQDEKGFMMYILGSFEYSDDNDDWACIEPPTGPYRYLRFPDNFQNESWDIILEYSTKIMKELEKEGIFNETLLYYSKVITTVENNKIEDTDQTSKSSGLLKCFSSYAINGRSKYNPYMAKYKKFY